MIPYVESHFSFYVAYFVNNFSSDAVFYDSSRNWSAGDFCVLSINISSGAWSYDRTIKDIQKSRL